MVQYGIIKETNRRAQTHIQDYRHEEADRFLSMGATMTATNQ